MGMVHGVPHVPDGPPPPAVPPGQPPDFSLVRQPVKAVLFDFHGTIAQVEDPVAWVLAAAAECGATLDRVLATSLADRLLTAGRAGGPQPARVPPHLAEFWADRDLDGYAHRAAYTGLAATVDAGIEGFAEALYGRILRAEGWLAYADTVPTMRALQAAGVPVAVVSNVGFDIRPIADDLGFARYVSAWALSVEVGRCKPDPVIFQHACRSLGVDPADTLMIGDTAADAGAVDVGCRALVLPSAAPGVVNGLAAALSLALS
jgi:HAD superfamily hydrolase (TIGR01509 family)